jgi:hypothetical protein
LKGAGLREKRDPGFVRKRVEIQPTRFDKRKV